MAEVLTEELVFGRYKYGYGTDGTQVRKLIWISDEVFDPILIFSGGKLGGYYNASILTSVWQDSAGTIPGVVGQVVGRLDDLSGNGHHLLQATTAAKPILRLDATLNKHYLERDGVDDQLTAAGLVTYNTEMHLILSLRNDSVGALTGYSSLFGFSNTTTTERFDASLRAEANYLYRGQIRYNGLAAVATVGAAGSAINRGTVFELIITGGSMGHYLKDSSAFTETKTAVPPLEGPDSVPIALFASAASQTVTRFYGGLVVVDTVSAANKASLRTYFSNLAGVTP